MTRKLIVTCLLVIPCATAFGWGAGHDVVARETLRVLPGVWGERLRAGEEGKLFLRTCHAPDDQSTKLADRSEYLDAEFRAAMDQGNGRPPVMYRLHAADARCEMIRAMARAMRRDDLRSVAFLLACFNHSVADTASANHSPLIQLVTYNWRALGLSGTVEDDCAVLEKTEEGKAIMRKTVDAAVLPLRKNPAGGKGVDAAAVWAACFADELKGMSFYRYDLDLAHGGTRALGAFAEEVAYPVCRSIEAIRTAEAFARLPEVPAFDVKAESKRAEAKAHDYLAARSIHDDSITRGLVPPKGKVPEVGVLYDPTGSWTRGIVYMANRSFSAQICTTLRKRHKAGLLDIRSVMKDGVPDGVKTVVFAASGLGGHQGFSASDVSRALAAFLRRGGRLVWVGGNPAPSRDLFPEGGQFTKNPVPDKWAWMKGPEPADRMPGGRLVLPDGRSFTCVRPPKGGAGWYWGQLGLSYVPPQTLPEGGREVLAYVSKDGQKTLVGYTVGNRTFLPAFALYPFVFTDETPCCNPLKLALDAAGAAVLESVL